jgi:hypothetical protein
VRNGDDPMKLLAASIGLSLLTKAAFAQSPYSRDADQADQGAVGARSSRPPGGTGYGLGNAR